MPKEIIVNARPYETRATVLENGKAAEIYVERSAGNLVGNIYRGRVVKVLPGMQSAFVDIGLEKDVFLYVEDVIATLEKMLELWGDDGEAKGKKPRGRRRHQAIKDLLKKGEYILVQVAKERIGTKAARVTSHVSLPGKYLVLMPTVGRIGVSRKITSQEERKRLREIVLEMRDPQLGYIIRTAADRCTKKSIKEDLDYLHELWKAITAAADEKEGVGLIYEELDLLRRILRDVFNNKFARIVVDDQDAYMAALDFVQRQQKSLAARVQLYTGAKPIFEEYGIEEEIEKSMRRKVDLRSGGSINIHQTEALVSIDVNSGRFVGSKSLEDTALKTNIEAIKEIINQLRLRDLGGIIVIDFIDMEKKANRTKLIESFNKELEKDGTEHTVLDVNEFGLVILTRKRVRKNLLKLTTMTCPYCEGREAVKNPETVTIDVLRELEKIAAEGVKGTLRVTLHPDVVEYMAGNMVRHIEWVSERNNLHVSVIADEKFHLEQFEIIEE